MTERLLFVRHYWLAPRTVEQAPAFKEVLKALRQDYQVDVFAWPGTVDGPTAPPTWEGAAAALRAALSPGCHVLLGGGAVAVGLMTLGRGVHPARSVVADHMDLPNATLRALGLSTLAEASDLLGRLEHPESWLRTLTGFVGLEAAKAGASDVDRAYLRQFSESWENLNLVDEAPSVAVPALYLAPPEGDPDFPEGEQVRAFLRFAPDAAVRKMQTWHRRRYDDPQIAAEFVEAVRGFLEGLGRRTATSTVLFTDIVDSTVHALQLGDRGWREKLESHHKIVRGQLSRWGGREIDNAGDGFFAAFDSAASALRCARAIHESLAEIGVEVRAGVHCGEFEVVGDKLGGVGVHAGARIAAAAGPGEVLASRTVTELVFGTGMGFGEPRRAVLKGLDGEWELYPLTSV